jgi:hypothetical protein
VSDEEERICLNTIRETRSSRVVPKLDQTIQESSRDVEPMIETIRKIVAFMRSSEFESYDNKALFMRETAFIISALKSDNYKASIRTSNLDILVEASALGRLCQSVINWGTT